MINILVQNLLKKLFAVDKFMLISETHETKDGIVRKNHYQRASVIMNLKDSGERFDDVASAKLIEVQHERIVKELYSILFNYMKIRDNLTAFQNISGYHTPNFNDESERLNWCLAAIYFLDIDSPMDRVKLSPMDKDGINLGFKREAVSSGDPITLEEEKEE